jgi:hypothetical protein
MRPSIGGFEQEMRMVAAYPTTLAAQEVQRRTEWSANPSFRNLTAKLSMALATVQVLNARSCDS